MSLQSELAHRHQADRVQLGRQLLGRVSRLWQSATVRDLDGSWNSLAPLMLQEVVAAQTKAAAMATPYMNAMDRSYGRATPPLKLVPGAFAGVTLDGREVAPAMYTAVTTTKRYIGGGMGAPMAFQAGANALAAVVSAALHDMGRQADITLGQARTYTKYVRVVGGSACSRCAILAGMYSGDTAFLRHTCCQCTVAPIAVTTRDGRADSYAKSIPDGFHDGPSQYFESLSKVDQDRVFTKAGAEAIRNGADISKVVNARRGAYGIGYSGHYNTPVSGNRLRQVTIGRNADGSPLKVFATTEGTTARGAFARSEGSASLSAAKDGMYRRTTSIRLMPEQIIQMAGPDVGRLRELLTRYGYMS